MEEKTTNSMQQMEAVDNEVVPVESKMEFRLINPTEDGFLRRIDWNKGELETAVRHKIAAYQNVVYTEDSMKQAKADRADLNKLTKAIEERRKMVKKIINEPYEVFEAELKEILALIQEPLGIIDRQIKAFEDQQKEEKKKSIRKSYDEAIGDLAEILSFEKVFDNRYLNKTYKLATAQVDVKEKIEKVRTDLETIDSLDSKYKLNAKDVYIKTLDLSKALAENKRLTDLEEKLEADKKRKEQEAAERAEIERKKMEEAKAKQAEQECQTREAEQKSAQQESVLEESVLEQPKAETEKVVEGTERQAAPTAVDPFTQQPAEGTGKKYRIKFAAVGTRQQLADLTQYMKDRNIEFGQLK